MKIRHLVLQLCLILSAALLAADEPVREALRVRKAEPPAGPRITPYLEFQMDLAWQQDKTRQARLALVQNQEDLQELRAELRKSLLRSIGGLPETKTPLNARVVGIIPLSGYHIEKIIFESLPKLYVTALLYVPDAAGRKPAVLVPCGHTTNGKIGYQYICHRLARLGYVALCWDPPGQGERSQFWDAASSKSRYNLVCGEHAVMGNLAYLAGTNLARWEIWDGVRAVDYLLTRPEVDAGRISIIGTSGGGFQSSHIGALDERIKVVVPSCYISALPMRMSNRIFADPDSDPEQDLYEMVSRGVDHPGLLLLCYPRPVFVAAAVEDFFPIEGTRKTLREVGAVYRQFGHAEEIGHVEGYHGHKFSPENLGAAFAFLDRFNLMPAGRPLPPEVKLDDRALWCTHTGQVSMDFNDGRSITDFVRDYWKERKDRTAMNLPEIYRGAGYPGIEKWAVVPFKGNVSEREIAWEAMGTTALEGLTVERYLLHHSTYLSIPLLSIRWPGLQAAGNTLLWFTAHGKVDPSSWNEVRELAGMGYNVLSFDFRGLGEDRMLYRVDSPGNTDSSRPGFDQAYESPLAGVLANYVYNSLLTGRPYFLQMIEDAEIVSRFAREKMKVSRIQVAAGGEGYTLACAISDVLPGISLLSQPDQRRMRWSELVDKKVEDWPVQYLLPGAAYIEH